MKKKIGIVTGAVLAIVIIVVGIIFFTRNNNPETESPAETSSQEIVSDQEEATEDKTTEETTNEETTTEEAVKKEVEVSGVMKETIDLSSVDLTKYGLTKNSEISVPYPTLLGCVYVVRDHGQSPERTYLFVTTKDKVLFYDTGFANSGEISLEKVTPIAGPYSLITADLDGEKGEEIVLLSNTGGNGGLGIYEHGIYKISNGKIVKMKISNEKPFTVTLESPYTVVFRNEKFDFEERIVCKSDSESLFDDNGNPETDNYSGGFYRPHEAAAYTSSEEKPTVSFLSYSYLSRSTDDDKTVLSSVEYVYDAKKKEFIISGVDVFVRDPGDYDYIYDIYGSEEGYYESISSMNGYIYYDINKDGVDEFITHLGTCEADRVYRVYTFEKGKMYCAGELCGFHGSFHVKDNGEIVVTNTGATENGGSFVDSTTCELVGNQLFEKESRSDIAYSPEEYDAIYDRLNITDEGIKINNLYYR